MLALAGTSLGLNFEVLDPSKSPPARSVSKHHRESFKHNEVVKLAERTDRLTLEFENIPLDCLNGVAIAPPAKALEVSQDRLLEKDLFSNLRLSTPGYKSVANSTDLKTGLAELGGKVGRLKTRRLGYDGKGQAVVTPQNLDSKEVNDLLTVPCILEEQIEFDYEVSLISVFSKNGEFASYPLSRNCHRNGILLHSAAIIDSELEKSASQMVKQIGSELKYVGVLAVEFFVYRNELKLNEMAPRVHNSGHWTIEGSATSQFENHLRAILGWPLGATQVNDRVEMWNLIGGVNWPTDDSELFSELLAIKGARLHRYGKEFRPNRKLGHLTLCEAQIGKAQFEASKAKLDNLLIPETE